MNFKATIIIPTYNRANLISETLESLIAQTYRNWECIIIDDGSTDNTGEVVGQFLKKDSRFQMFLRPENHLKGPSGCRNFGIKKAIGDFILFFDDDDIMHPQNLELSVLELSSNNVSFCRYTRDIFFDDFAVEFDFSKHYSSFLIDSKHIESILKHELFCITGSILWKKECFEAHRFVEILTYGEEWELYSRIISSGFKGVSINKCLFYGRKHSNAATAAFYGDNPKSKRSYKDAILLVVKNLDKKQLLSDAILRYFIQLSLTFKEFNLFEDILSSINGSKKYKLKWRFLYAILPLKLKLYRYWKRFKK